MWNAAEGIGQVQPIDRHIALQPTRLLNDEIGLEGVLVATFRTRNKPFLLGGDDVVILSPLLKCIHKKASVDLIDALEKCNWAKIAWILRVVLLMD